LVLAGCSGRSNDDLVASGKTFVDQKDWPAAIIQLKAALQAQPNSAQARLLLGQSLLAAGDPASALVELEKAQELQVDAHLVVPAMARAMVMVGDAGRLLARFGEVQLQDPLAAADLMTSLAAAHLMRGDLDKARPLIDRALQTTPDFPAAMVLNARIAAAEGQLDASLQMLDGVLKKHPDNEAAGVLKGQVLLKGKRDTAAALAAFQQVIAQHPKSVDAYTTAIAILLEQNKNDDAKLLLSKLKASAPNHPETVFFEAQYALGNKDYKRSRELTNQLLKVMPENARVLELSGLAEYHQGRHVEAEAFLSKALKAAPGLLDVRRLLAQTYLKSMQPAKALEVLQPLIEGKTLDAVSLAMAGEAWLMAGEVKKSDAAFAKATSVAPQNANLQTASALAQMMVGNNSAAISQLDRAVAQDKGSRSDMALFVARMRASDLGGALKALDGLAAKSPESPLSDNLRGRVLLVKGDTVGAQKSFQAALAKDPSYFPAVASLAALDLSSGRIEAARKRFEDVTQSQPKSHEPWLALAELSARSGGTSEQVVGYMRSGVKANPGHPAPHLSLIKQLVNMGDGKAALAAAREGTAAVPNNPELMSALGRAQLLANSVDQAVQTFKQLTTLQPSNPEHRVNLADALLASKDADNAQASYQRALELDPELPAAQQGVVKAAMLAKRPQDALRLAKEMQKKYPNEPLLFRLEGDVEFSLRNADGAVAAYRKALQLNRNGETAALLHGAYLRLNRKDDAARFASEWLREKPKDAVFRYHLGDVALAQDDAAGAEKHYRSVLELQPNNPLALNNVAWLLVRSGRPGAVAMAERATKLMPGNPALLDTLAGALAADNQMAKAIEIQKQAVNQSQGNPSLRLGLAKMLLKFEATSQAKSELESLAKLGDAFASQAEVTALLKGL
jgi:putative PEP-CTERM system TPR-repeat lipoprotein